MGIVPPFGVRLGLEMVAGIRVARAGDGTAVDGPKAVALQRCRILAKVVKMLHQVPKAGIVNPLSAVNERGCGHFYAGVIQLAGQRAARHGQQEADQLVKGDLSISGEVPDIVDIAAAQEDGSFYGLIQFAAQIVGVIGGHGIDSFPLVLNQSNATKKAKRVHRP